jgi:tripartite-type tricarboxylate transporter receptor subunit TctC
MLILMVALLALPKAASAQSAAYPNKPIRMVVPFAAGGPTDIFARAVGREIATTLGQPVVIDNRPGAGGNLGADIVAKAPPDGYTIVMGATGAFSVNTTLDPKLPYDVLRDFAPISLVTIVPFVLVVHPGVPVKTVDDLIKLAKSKPGALSFGSAGTGTSMHMASEMFKTMTGSDIVHVPYKGAAPAVSDLVAGHVQLIFSDMVSALPHVRTGKLRAVAVTQRSPLYPDVPTFAEAGLAGYDANAWYALFAPAGTPKDIVTKLSAATAKALQSQELRDRLAGEGAQAVGSTPEELDRFVRNEIVKWAKVVKASGTKIE